MHVRYLGWDESLTRAQTLDDLVKLFLKLVNTTGGNADEALKWMRALGARHGFFSGDPSFDDLLRELEERGLIRSRDAARPGRREGARDRGDRPRYELTERGEHRLRRDAFDELFTGLRRDALGGDHATPHGADRGGEPLPETRTFEWGDAVRDLDVTRTVQNAIRRGGLDDPDLAEADMEVHHRERMISCATVLAIDVSHSMVLYGEDRITPARTLAMALTEYIQRQFPKDAIDVILFGDEAFVVPLKELPYITAGPFHTNTKAALELGQAILRTKKQANRQIILITDGKPSAIHERGGIYKNPFGLDPKVVSQTINEAVACRRNNIVITTFMITSDPYLRRFVEEMTLANRGRAYYTDLDRLGSFVFEDYVRNKRRRA